LGIQDFKSSNFIETLEKKKGKTDRFNDDDSDAMQSEELFVAEDLSFDEVTSKSVKKFRKSNVTKHLKTFQEKEIICEVPECKKQFKKISALKQHVKNIHKNHNWKCSDCGESVKDLPYHMKTVHDHLNFQCSVCAKKYTSKQGLNFHLKHVHGDSKKEVCDYCAVEVKHVKHHIKMMHSGVLEKKIPCKHDDCDKKFRTKQESTIHYNAAHLNKKEMCPLCGGWYKNLYTHIHQTHQNEKKHICDQCGKAFGKKNDLKIHKDRIHLLKRYTCPECGKTISKIREHLKTIHNVMNIKMEEIEVVKFDHQKIEKGLHRQLKPYLPEESKETIIPVSMVTSQPQSW